MLTGVVARAVTLKEKRKTTMVNTMGLLLQEQRWSVSRDDNDHLSCEKVVLIRAANSGGPGRPPGPLGFAISIHVPLNLRAI
jgi:hypothetical protein